MTIPQLAEQYVISGGRLRQSLSKDQNAYQAELRGAYEGSVIPHGDVIIPWGSPARDPRESRDMTATGGLNLDQGGYAIETEKMPLGLALRSALVLPRLGGRLFTGLRGNIDQGFGKGDLTAEWLAENEAASDLNEVLGTLSMSPKRVTATIPISTQLIVQGGPNFVEWLQEVALQCLGVEIERGAIAGTGAGGEPYGILYHSAGSVAGGVDGAAPTATHLSDLEYAVTGTNHAGSGRLGWLVSPLGRRKLRHTPAVTGGSSPVWAPDKSDELFGYPAGVTTAVPDNLIKGVSTDCSAIIFGDFGSQVTAMWGPGIGVSFVSDVPGYIAGKTYVVMSAYVDSGVKDSRSFEAMKDALCA